ncbi:MAG: RNA polymerase sigma factor RpoH [Alphaproteobacteria bacterium]|nr:RNA polymerase sigma factor RpoH [Alphaproteobacteria bacterium]
MPHLPALRRDGNLAIYLSDIRKFPILDADEEYMLAKSWKEHGDLEAAHKLVTSHLRLVAKIAVGYRGYGLPLADLIAEGNIGMMQAVKRFDPDRGFRLSTYAMWWIRAAIQEYILHSWSLVKIGTTAAQKKLFFNLRRLKGEMKAINDGDLSSEQVEEIAERLSVPKEDVITMNRRMIGSDQSLNARVSKDGESTEEWQDWLVEPSSGADEQLGEEQELTLRQRLLSEAMEGLTARERMIIVERRLSEKPSTLEELSQKLGISRERVRQIELRGFEKLQYAIKRAAEEESAADF